MGVPCAYRKQADHRKEIQTPRARCDELFSASEKIKAEVVFF
jgi:hypothetical protein